jgi:hypothetical protein
MKSVTLTDKCIEDITNWLLEVAPSLGVDPRGWTPFVALSVRNALENLPNDFTETHMLLSVISADVAINEPISDWPDQKAQLFAQLMINGQTGDHKLYSTREVPVNDDYEARVVIAEAKELYDNLDGEDPVPV